MSVDLSSITPPLCTAIRDQAPLSTIVAIVTSGCCDDVNTREEDSSEFTPLMIAAQCGAQRETVRFLIGAGADVSLTSAIYKFTPLMLAARWGHVGVVEELLLHGAEVDVAGFQGRTALVCAVHGNQVQCASLLLRCGASLSYTRENVVEIRVAVKDRARELGHLEIVSLIESEEEKRSSPSALISMCAKTIRQQLNTCRQKGVVVKNGPVSTITDKTNTLPIPTTLKEYILQI